MALRPVNTEKHETVWSKLSQDASGVQIEELARATDPSGVNLNTEVITGSVIKSLYLEFQFSAETITTTKIVHWMICKLPTGKAIGVPSLYGTADKRHIFKRGMEMLPKSVNTIIKRIVVVKIPKGKQRMGENDVWQLQWIVTSAETVNACGFCIYKHFN